MVRDRGDHHAAPLLVALGLSVPVRADGDRGVIDWPAFAATVGLVGGEPGQRPLRAAPADGIEDTSVVSKALKLFRNGDRTTAMLEAAHRCTVLGMPTVNWDRHLRLADGTTTVLEAEEVPPYAWWLTVPGASLTVVVDPGNPHQAAVDWPAVATAAAQAGPAALHDRPPDGSIAAEVVATAPRPTVVSEVGGEDPAAVIAANRDVAMANATLRDSVGEVQAGRMKPKASLKYVAEWESAGMCTAEEAATARTAAGLTAELGSAARREPARDDLRGLVPSVCTTNHPGGPHELQPVRVLQRQLR